MQRGFLLARRERLAQKPQPEPEIFGGNPVASGPSQPVGVGSTPAVLEWPEINLSVLHFLMLPDLSSASAVSTSLSRSALSDSVWRPLCERRWRSKWGFAARWERHTCGEEEPLPWHHRYWAEEADARRNWIRVEELHALRFDFRMRFDVQSSCSSEMRFGPAAWDAAESHVPAVEAAAGVGSVSGHPAKDARLTWVLDPDNQGLQWGLWPQYWPKGRVHRLPSWGWQVINRNVVMRALEPGSSDSVESRDQDGLWADLLAELVHLSQYGDVFVPSRWLPLGTGL